MENKSTKMPEVETDLATPEVGSPGKVADGSPEAVAVDRPGFDLGGSTGKTSAGTGLGLGPDASEKRRDRNLP